MIGLIKKIKEHPFYVKYQVFILPLVSFVICIALLILVVFPNVMAFSKNNDQINELKAKTDSLKQKISALESVDADLYKKNTSLALTILPSEKNIPEALNQVLLLLSSNRLQLLDISLSSSEQAKQGTQSFGVKVEVSGEESSVRNFILDTKETLRLMGITKIDITGGTNGVYQASVNLDIFYEALPTSLGSLDQPVTLPSKSELDLLAKAEAAQATEESDSQSSVPIGKDNLFE